LIFLYLVGNSAWAQPQRAMLPHLQLHAANPSLSLSTPTTNPLQQQLREDTGPR
jgi:hypothetical protein